MSVPESTGACESTPAAGDCKRELLRRAIRPHRRGSRPAGRPLARELPGASGLPSPAPGSVLVPSSGTGAIPCGHGAGPTPGSGPGRIGEHPGGVASSCRELGVTLVITWKYSDHTTCMAVTLFTFHVAPLGGLLLAFFFVGGKLLMINRYFSDNLRLQDGGCCPFEAADLCCCSPGAPGARWLQLAGAPGFLAQRSVVRNGQQPPSQICMLISAEISAENWSQPAKQQPASSRY